VQGLSETLVGSSFILIQQSFSRTMETEADAFSINSLKRLGISTDEFVIAMEAIIDSNESDSWEEKIYFKYLSSHPDLKDRIEMIKEN
ncbi:MAG: M48 family metalloprotease, partial [Gammaproteobacteria bacterium]